ncbi:ATPase family AAA domain-containing protein 3B [Cytospora mali]|uniref:ATPase family AAA domain-containing protein 3B n=1 Tax=Cytospora mali TaxID=578113 RepID=A0A194W3P3_CYTMA|nr:ATPase family AAA domain-containing protein 3B [Valsa mali]
MTTPEHTPAPGDPIDEAGAEPEATELPTAEQSPEDDSDPTCEPQSLEKVGDEGQHDEGEHSDDDETSSYRYMSASSRVKAQMNLTSEKLMDYIANLESRIERLETTENHGNHSELQESRASRSSSSSSRIRRSYRARSEIEEARTPQPHIQFFLESDEPLPSQGKAPDHRWRMRGIFRSELDMHPLIRVLYRWIGPKSNDGQNAPSPKDIDILELRISSKPIADFLTRRLEYDISLDDVIHLGKPFRTLIRNFSSIKEERDRLVEQETLNESDRPSSHTEAHETTDASQHTDGDSEKPESVPSRNTDSDNPVDDFQRLVEFVETYMGTSLALFNDYASGSLTKITFENLWMLFDIGENIYCPLKKGGLEIKPEGSGPLKYTTVAGLRPQVYRVSASLEGSPRGRRISGSKVLRATATIPSSGLINNYLPLHVICFSLDFKMGKIVILDDVFKFLPFDGEVEITSLEAYPLRYRRHSSANDEDLVARGLAFVDLMLVRHRKYDGLTASENEEEISSDVIVDHGVNPSHRLGLGVPAVQPSYDMVERSWFAGMRFWEREIYRRICNHAECPDGSCSWDYYFEYQLFRYREMRARFNAKVEEKDLEIRGEEDMARCRDFLDKEDLLCLFGGIINGYSLRNRKWVRLDINLLRPVSYEDGWNELVLPEGHRKMVQAMVETYAADSQLKTGARDLEQPQPNIDRVEFDPVKEKGQGCVILLHGAPGVGKTSTAECVAAYTRRPLLPLTAGDFGFAPEDVERRLEEHFNLAQRWGCVLLLDEADVFLVKRTKDDIQRNGLVSVFLRVLEYYKGILILTTNRVGAFDEAFHSRIHLSLYYPTLDREKTLEIFKTHFRRIKKHNEERVQKGDVEIGVEKKLIRKYWRLNHKVLKWNGRQIRNAFQTAMALAEYDARDSGGPPVITVKHFEIIANASADFAKYVTEVQGAEADQIAMRDRNRLDRDPKVSSKLKKLHGSSSDSSESEESKSEDSSGDDSDDVDDKKKRKKSRGKGKGKSKDDRKDDRKDKTGKKSKRDKKDKKGKKDSESGKGDGRGSKDSSSDEDD